MFVVILTYLKPIEEVDRNLMDHRHYLDEGYQRNYFLTSGPQNPRTGGIILSHLSDRNLLEEIMDQDPFVIRGIASYQIIEFSPNKCHPDFVSFM